MSAVEFLNGISGRNSLSNLLVSVRSVREAELIKHLDVGILDVKEPSRGGLGASDRETIREIAKVVNGSGSKVDLSFSAGELMQWYSRLNGKAGDEGTARSVNQSSQSPLSQSLIQPLIQHYGVELLSQYRFVKVGLAGVTTHSKDGQFDWRSAWRQLFADLPSPTRAVAVAYLDFRDCGAPTPSEVIKLAGGEKSAEAVLFDTCYKSGDLFSHVSITEISDLVQNTLSFGLIPVVAGSVGLDCLSKVVTASPDFVGVRGAVCEGNRAGGIVPELVGEFIRELRAVVSSQGSVSQRI